MPLAPIVRMVGKHDAAEGDPIGASVVLAQRARSLRESAASMHPLVASAYRRRAAELAVAAWVGAVRSGVDEPTAAIAGAFGDDPVEPAPLDAA